MKAMELQSDPKNRQSYKRLFENYNINLKSNDDIYKYRKSDIKKSQSIPPTFQKTTAYSMMKGEQI